jgi:hypothetical protein
MNENINIYFKNFSKKIRGSLNFKKSTRAGAGKEAGQPASSKTDLAGHVASHCDDYFFL